MRGVIRYSRWYKSDQIVLVQEDVHEISGRLAMYHMIYSLWVILAEVYRSGFCFSERIAASSVEECRSRANDGFVNSVSSHPASDCEVGILSKLEKSGPVMLDQTQICIYWVSRKITYVFIAFMSSSVGESIVDGRRCEAGMVYIFG